MNSPLALVYRGRASLPGCPEAAADVLRGSPLGFGVRYVGEDDLTPRTLASAVLYVQPGGGDLKPAWRRLRRASPAVRDFVASGGRYLGFCLGGYLAGHSPGFGLLEGDTDQYCGTPGAEVGDRATVIEVQWDGRLRRLYFEDGCCFAPGPCTQEVATYRNGRPAAVVSPFGAGRVAVCGPHPEASDDWFSDDGLVPVRPSGRDLALDLLHRLMAA